MAEVLQKLSVKHSSATSCNRLMTPGERTFSRDGSGRCIMWRRRDTGVV
jgi:hypothetical protein